MDNYNVTVVDIETCSAAKLKKCGAHVYAAHDTTDLICASWYATKRFRPSPATSITPKLTYSKSALYHVIEKALEAGHKIVAHNAAFERVHFKELLDIDIPEDQWIDTMALAAYYGLPLALEDAMEAGPFQYRKDKEGHALMLRMSRPRAFNTDGSPRWWHEEDDGKKERIGTYCENDVTAETELMWFLPDLPEIEQECWEMVERGNCAGLPVDKDLITRLKALVRQKSDTYDRKMDSLTNGRVTSCSQVTRIQELLMAEGMSVPEGSNKISLAKTELDYLISIAPSPLAREVLELRQLAAKTSTAKLDAMERWTCRDGTIKGMIAYYGASRTGRAAGRGPQIQNYAKPSIRYVDLAIAFIKGGASLEMVETIFGPVLDVVSSCLRGCIAARAGRKLISNDLSQIEARVLPWMSGQLDILQVFERGEDVYVYQATQMGSEDRQLGKVAVLSLGFQAGAARFVEMAKGYGIILTLEEAQEVVTAWRNTNPKTVKLWRRAEDTARQAIECPNRVLTVPGTNGKLRYIYRPKNYHKKHSAGCLIAILPSGRALFYRDAELSPEPNDFGQHEISYMGMNQYTRKWERIGTYGGKLVENAVQAAARDVLFYSMLEAEREFAVEWLVSIHDEGIASASDETAFEVLQDTQTAMETPPLWAITLPLASEGYVAERYRK